MVLCPVALAVGCKKCPVFAICPAKSLIGDQPSAADAGKGSAKPKSGRKTRG
jgi:hypothetical protein